MKIFQNKIYKSWHSHLENIETNGYHLEESSFVGQINAREASSIIVNLAQTNQLRGKPILFSGPVGTGKTALALGIASKLGDKIPFYMIHGAEIFSPVFKKTGLLLEKSRRAVGLRIFQNYEFYEGEITAIELNLEKKKNPSFHPSVIIFIKTTEESLKIKLSDSLYEKFMLKKLEKGDIIRIEPKENSIKRIGKSLNSFTGQINGEEKYLTTPIGKVLKKKSIVRETSLYDLDSLNSSNLSKQKFEKFEKTDQLINEVNLLVSSYIREKKAEIVTGILFIDEAHFLDQESLCFLCKILDSSFSPIIILATNRTTFFRRNTSWGLRFPHTFLNRCLTIRTKDYNRREISMIISLKSRESKNFLSGKCFLELCKLAGRNSLRFSILLTAFSRSLIKISSSRSINFGIIKLSFFLFFHLKETCKLFSSLKPTLKIFRTF